MAQKHIKFFLLLFLLPIINSYAAEIDIAWDPNNEPDLAGYGVYFSKGKAGPPYDIFGYVDVSELHDPKLPEIKITGIDSKFDYFFAITAYDKAGNESTFSDAVKLKAGDAKGPSFSLSNLQNLTKELKPAHKKTALSELTIELKKVKSGNLIEATKLHDEMLKDLYTKDDIVATLNKNQKELDNFKENYQKEISELRDKFIKIEGIRLLITDDNVEVILSRANVISEIKARKEFENKVEASIKKIDNKIEDYNKNQENRTVKVENDLRVLFYFIFGIFISIIAGMVPICYKYYRSKKSTSLIKS
jgi:hypothetical protein